MVYPIIFFDMELRQFEMYFLTATTALIICIIIRNLASSSSRRERQRGTRGEGGTQPYGIIYNYTFWFIHHVFSALWCYIYIYIYMFASLLIYPSCFLIIHHVFSQRRDRGRGCGHQRVSWCSLPIYRNPFCIVITRHNPAFQFFQYYNIKHVQILAQVPFMKCPYYDSIHIVMIPGCLAPPISTRFDNTILQGNMYSLKHFTRFSSAKGT